MEVHMPQNGIHAMVGVVSRKWMPLKEWVFLGLVLGNMFPDLDNVVVAYASLAGLPDPEQYHRTFTHSIFTVLAVVLFFYIIGAVTKSERWKSFGFGFGAGILMHILLDLVLWFNGVELFWPLGGEINFWSGFVVPSWLKMLLETGEFLAFGLYFLMLASLAARYGTDRDRQRSPRIWAYVEFVLFILFTLLFFTIGTTGIVYQVFGGLYLVSLIVGMVITIRMRQTVETL
jgi:membrane-bound metal-dependent hydrolase YbcI (DUF457 family)